MNTTADNAFIGACMEFDDLLEYLQELRAKNFNVDRNNVAVGDCESVTLMNEKLRDALGLITERQEGKHKSRR